MLKITAPNTKHLELLVKIITSRVLVPPFLSEKCAAFIERPPLLVRLSVCEVQGPRTKGLMIILLRVSCRVEAIQDLHS
jgi:hypothetical protein